MALKFTLILCIGLSFTAQAATDCKDLSAVAKEGVAYSMLGAWEAFTTHSCFKNERYKYFRPELGYPMGEVNDASAFLYFDKTKDVFKIESIKPAGDDFDIAVRFHIGNKNFVTHYTYKPSPDYQKNTGACGYIVNWDQLIFRKDCVVSERIPASKK